MPRLTLLIGLPGSGKSFLAQRWVQQCPKRRLIATDTIRAQLFGDEAIQGSWLQIWREVERQFRQSVLQIRQGNARAAMYDATNARRKQRREAIALARQAGFTQITGLWLNVPLWLCLERNRERDRQVPEVLILGMSQRLGAAPPSVQEGLDYLIKITPPFQH